MQSTLPPLRGIFRDVLVGPDGHTRYDSGWTNNTVVDRGRALLAAFLANGPTQGIRFLAVGRGLPQWDTDGTPAPDPAAIDLLDRYQPAIPVGDLNVAFLDDGGNVVQGPTTRLQVTATLEAGYPAVPEGETAYPLREFGLFGEFGGGPFMINSVRHGVIQKDPASTLIRVIRLTF
ncbi:MAG TPA: hypothetical protein VFJ82_09900 [Longimicrobium sp.]|nr:hypothetical protein [Longimicrobium sp.]